MKKLGLLFVTIIFISSCTSWEERAQSAECEQGNYNYKIGNDLGQLAGLSKDGKRDCKWGKDFAVKSKFYEIYHTEPPRYNDCWCQGYLDGYDEARILKLLSR